MSDGHCQMAREEEARKRREREKAEKPSLAEAIDRGRVIYRDLQQLEHLSGGPVIDAKENAPVVRRLVEAGEKWLEFEQEERDRRVESRGLEIATEAMSAEKDRRIKELKEEADARKAHAKYQREIAENLRSRLAEKPRPAPTQAEVDRVAVRIAREMDRADRLTLSQSREVARHVIERGYKPEEE